MIFFKRAKPAWDILARYHERRARLAEGFLKRYAPHVWLEYQRARDEHAPPSA